jgi:hypothetical protein
VRRRAKPAAEGDRFREENFAASQSVSQSIRRKVFHQVKAEFVGLLIRRKILSGQVVAITHQNLKLEERGTANHPS